MYDPLGLSIGTTNFVAVRSGAPPVRRRSQLTLIPHRAPQLGVPAENPDSAGIGLRIDGFVERVGECEPLIATDGSAHRPELLLVDAIDAMVGTAGDVSGVAIAVPAHWPPETWRLLQDGLQTHAGVATLGGTPYLVSDAVAALAALHAERGVATRGVVALLDFGGGGTSITLADAGSAFVPICQTLRYHRFSGNRIDQELIGYILGSNEPANGVARAGTAMVGDLGRLAEECRHAKERLSVQTATEMVVELPGYQARIALTRAELEQLIRGSLTGVLAALEDMLQRNRIGWNNLAALAIVGGGAQIPLVTEQLSTLRRVPVIASAQPVTAIAVGATLCARARAATAPAMASTVTAATAPAGPSVRSTTADAVSAAPLELAWSREEVRDGDEPLPFIGDPYDDREIRTRPPAPRRPARRPGRARRGAGLSQLMVGVAGLVAAIAVAGVAYSVMRSSGDTIPEQPAGSSTVPAAAPSPEPVEPAPVAPQPSVVVKPSSPAPPAPPPVATTSQQPATTTAAPPATTTATTPPASATTTPTVTPTTSVAPPTTSSAVPSAETPTTVPMRTEYLTIPLVPVPIPIQVPAN